MSEIGAFELVFLLLRLFIVIFGLFALKVNTPYPHRFNGYWSEGCFLRLPAAS